MPTMLGSDEPSALEKDRRTCLIHAGSQHAHHARLRRAVRPQQGASHGGLLAPPPLLADGRRRRGIEEEVQAQVLVRRDRWLGRGGRQAQVLLPAPLLLHFDWSCYCGWRGGARHREPLKRQLGLPVAHARALASVRT